jgi:hypothetical protein
VKPYQFDPMLTQLRLAGLLSGVAALVFGQMPDCEQHPEQGYRLDEVLADLTAGLGVSVLAGLPSGHTSGGALTLPLGLRCRVSAHPPRAQHPDPGGGCANLINPLSLQPIVVDRCGGRTYNVATSAPPSRTSPCNRKAYGAREDRHEKPTLCSRPASARIHHGSPCACGHWPVR